MKASLIFIALSFIGVSSQAAQTVNLISSPHPAISHQEQQIEVGAKLAQKYLSFNDVNIALTHTQLEPQPVISKLTPLSENTFCVSGLLTSQAIAAEKINCSLPLKGFSHSENLAKSFAIGADLNLQSLINNDKPLQVVAQQAFKPLVSRFADNVEWIHPNAQNVELSKTVVLFQLSTNQALALIGEHKDKTFWWIQPNMAEIDQLPANVNLLMDYHYQLALSSSHQWFIEQYLSAHQLPPTREAGLGFAAVLSFYLDEKSDELLKFNWFQAKASENKDVPWLTLEQIKPFGVSVED